MVRIVEAEQHQPTEEEQLVKAAREYIRIKDVIANLTKEANRRRDELAELVIENGEEDESGHFWLELPEDVEGYIALKRERRVSQVVDTEAAEQLLTERGLYDRCFKLVPTLDEDAVMACVYDDLLTADDLDVMFPKKITWAFVPSKKR